MFLYSWVLGFVVDVLSIDHHIDSVVGELIQPSVERIVTAVWFGIEWFV